MPIYMRNTTDVKPFEGPRESGPDVKVFSADFNLPAAVDTFHTHTNEAVTLNFTLTGGTFDLSIQLLVPPAHTDPLL